MPAGMGEIPVHDMCRRCVISPCFLTWNIQGGLYYDFFGRHLSGWIVVIWFHEHVAIFNSSFDVFQFRVVAMTFNFFSINALVSFELLYPSGQ